MAQYESLVFNSYDDNLTLEENKERNAVITKEIMDTLSAAVHAATAPIEITVTGEAGATANGSVLESDTKKSITITVPQPKWHEITIASSDWDSSAKTATVSISGISGSSHVTLSDESCTDDQATALWDADLDATLGDGAITFTCSGTIPTVDIPLIIKVE